MKKFLYIIPFITSITVTAMDTARIVLEHQNAKQIARLFPKSNILIASCLDENAILLYGPSQQVQNIAALIKTKFDVPYLNRGGRFGDNIISK